jgi:hypothetical protein
MRRLALTILAALALAGCGKANLAVIPTHPLYVCWAGRGRSCEGRFDTRKLLGLEMPDAEKVAEKHRFTVRPVEIDGHGVPMTDDYRPDRLDVALRDHIVVKIVGRG